MFPDGYWAPNSPDCNPIELAWAQLGEVVAQKQPRSLQALRRVLREAWEAITDDMIESWYHANFRRAKAIILANGDYVD